MSKSLSTQYERALFYLDRKVAKAARDFCFLRDGERILIGLSGGKDSTVLLQVLAYRRRWRKERCHLEACHVRGPALPSGLAGADQAEEAFLATMCHDLQIPFHVVEADALPLPESPRRELSPCFLCARRRRKALAEKAAALGLESIALGHHMNDAAETLLLNLLWQGRCEGMLPKVTLFGGGVTLIRPLIYIEEKDIARAYRLGGFPVTSQPCEFADSSRRRTAAAVLRRAQQGGAHTVAANLLRAGLHK